MTVTVEHIPTEHSGLGTTPHYRCHCGELFRSASAAHQCRHRLRSVPVMRKSHDDASSQLNLLEVPDA